MTPFILFDAAAVRSPVYIVVSWLPPDAQHPTTTLPFVACFHATRKTSWHAREGPAKANTVTKLHSPSSPAAQFRRRTLHLLQACSHVLLYVTDEILHLICCGSRRYARTAIIMFYPSRRLVSARLSGLSHIHVTRRANACKNPTSLRNHLDCA